VALSAFDDKTNPPGPDDLAPVLAGAWPAWAQLREALDDAIGPVTGQWAFTSKSTGWGYRVKRGDRVIVYMTPQRGQLLVGFVLGEKAVREAHASDLPAGVLATIEAAKQYAEGKGVRFELTDASAVPSMVALARIKLAS
jgi:hypothetical protein